jgi:predicted dienelactone hydrolase
MTATATHSPGASAARRRRLLGLLAGSAALLAACGAPRPAARRDNDAELKRFTERGYEAAAFHPIYPERDRWRTGDEEIVVELLMPRRAEACPLVIYLPGMDESADAGESWRKAWAQAGYAVASFQDPRNTAPGRHSGDHKAAAREQFEAKALAARIGLIDTVVRGIARRAAAADGVYGRIDTKRIAVAGYDLGAQTALALAGERHPDLRLPPGMPPLRAAIVLSPYANLARGGFAERFGAVGLPVLAVTGTEDTDPHGVVDSPHTRQAPFKYMPPGGKYQLVLEDGTHQTVGGASRPAPVDAGMDGPTRGGANGERPAPPGGRGGRGGPGGTGGTGPMGGERGGPPEGAGIRSPDGSGSQRLMIIVERVSLAFLDAYVKDDPVAREWLARDARRWIGPLARLDDK